MSFLIESIFHYSAPLDNFLNGFLDFFIGTVEFAAKAGDTPSVLDVKHFAQWWNFHCWLGKGSVVRGSFHKFCFSLTQLPPYSAAGDGPCLLPRIDTNATVIFIVIHTTHEQEKNHLKENTHCQFCLTFLKRDNFLIFVSNHNQWSLMICKNILKELKLNEAV